MLLETLENSSAYTLTHTYTEKSQSPAVVLVACQTRSQFATVVAAALHVQQYATTMGRLVQQVRATRRMSVDCR